MIIWVSTERARPTVPLITKERRIGPMVAGINWLPDINVWVKIVFWENTAIKKKVNKINFIFYIYMFVMLVVAYFKISKRVVL